MSYWQAPLGAPEEYAAMFQQPQTFQPVAPQRAPMGSQAQVMQGEEPVSPDTIAARRRLAQAMMQEGTSYAPVQHWTQAAARVAQALVGGANLASADTASRQAAAAARGRGKADEQEVYAKRAQIAEQYGLKPGSPEFQQYVITGQYKASDPLDDEEQRARIAKLQQEATNPGRVGEYGLNPQYAQDAEGNIVPWVPGKAGDPKVITLPDGMKALAPAEMQYQRAKGKELGEAAGTAQADLRRIEDNAGLALSTIEAIRQHPGRQGGLGMSAWQSVIPGSQERGFANIVDQAAGQTFLEAFNSLRGGGQITEAEGKKATQALARLDRYQSEEDFETALKDLENVIRTGIERAKSKAGGFSAAPSGGLGAGEYVFNPTTGRVEPKR